MKVVIGSQPRLLNVLRGVVRYCAATAGFPEEEVESLALAIDEAAANVIRHAYGNEPCHFVSLEIRPHSDRLEFLLEDSAPKVDPKRIQPRPLDELRPGGLGTFFIQRCMDSTAFDEQFVGGNRLKMVKYLPRKGSLENEGSSSKSG